MTELTMNKNNCVNWMIFLRDLQTKKQIRDKFNRQLNLWYSSVWKFKDNVDVNHYVWSKLIDGEKYVRRT